MFINQDKFFDSFLFRYNILYAKSDRLEAKMDKAEAEGDTEKYKRLDRKDDEILSEMRGMDEVLWMLGYRIILQNGELRIIEI